MEFFDRDVHGGFDAMFDFNRDGKLDPTESMMQMGLVSEVMSSSGDDERREALVDAGMDPDDYDF